MTRFATEVSPPIGGDSCWSRAQNALICNEPSQFPLGVSIPELGRTLRSTTIRAVSAGGWPFLDEAGFGFEPVHLREYRLVVIQALAGTQMGLGLKELLKVTA
jgi:hypothetical protein